jgi:hypothetical protein
MRFIFKGEFGSEGAELFYFVGRASAALSHRNGKFSHRGWKAQPPGHFGRISDRAGAIFEYKVVQTSKYYVLK